MITANQLRAARALLDISQSEIAQAVGISANTISNIEKGTSRPAHETLSRLQSFFELQGVEFTDNEGVRKKAGQVKNFKGHDGFIEFVREPDQQLIEFAQNSGLHMGQWLSVPMILGGAWLILTAKNRRVRVEPIAGSESVA